MTFYLDASAIIPILVDEPARERIDRFLAEHHATHVVTDFAAGEFASAVSRLVRMSVLTVSNADEALADFDDWRLTDCIAPAFDLDDLRLAINFVRRFDLKLRLPDAIHAATCRRLGSTLVTFDVDLARAAQMLGIAVVMPA